ncbi:helix-turn-helix domain-containing protein [Kibdelosporangium lantanae]
MDGVEYLTGFGPDAVPWPLRLRRPPPWLARHVLFYAMHGVTGGFRTTSVPHHMATMVVDVGDPTLASPVFGVFDRPQDLEVPGHWRGVSVILTPWSAGALFRLDMHTLTNSCVRLGDLAGPRSTDLSYALAAEPDWPRRFALLDRTLAGWFDGLPAPSPEVVAAWTRLVADPTRIAVDQLARDVGWSRRRLEMRFRDQVGVPPRTVGRISRFHHAVRQALVSDLQLGEVAAACGYYDQAHLTRDIRALTGRTPTQLLAGLSHSSKTAPPTDG